MIDLRFSFARKKRDGGAINQLWPRLSVAMCRFALYRGQCVDEIVRLHLQQNTLYDNAIGVSIKVCRRGINVP